MIGLLLTLSLSQAPTDVPRAELSPPRLELGAPAPLQARVHLVHQDPAQGSYRWREIGGGAAGLVAGYLVSVQLTYLAARLSPGVLSTRWLGFDVRYTYPVGHPPLVPGLINVLGQLTLPNVGAAVGALWASEGPRSGGFWRALLYGYAGELAVFVGGILAAALVGQVIGQQKLPDAGAAVIGIATYAAPAVLSSFGLHGGDPHWVQAPGASF